MHLSMIWTIFRKDLRDAVRDGRVLIAVLFPVGLGIFYNIIFDEESLTLRANLAYAAADQTRLPAVLRDITSDRAAVSLTEVADPDEVRRLAADEEIDVGLIVPAGFDAAVAAGESPSLSVIRPESAGFGTNYLVAALDEALRQLSGRSPPARIETTTVGEASESGVIFDRIGAAPYFVITNAVFVVVMVSLFAVPAILTEESERKTLDALVMIASYFDVVIAKALIGLAYIAVAVPLLLVLTRRSVTEPLQFGVAILMLSVCLIGFGLLIGGLFRTVTQLNTWSSFILLPFVGPIFATGLPVPESVFSILSALPTSQATRLAINTFTGEPIFENPIVSYSVIAAWGVLAYLLLLLRLSRRES